MTDRKNILIVTPFYKQDKNIASVRWTKLSERLAKNHNIIIVTQPLIGSDDTFSLEPEENGVIVARIDQTTGYQHIARKYFGAAKDDDWQTNSNSSVNSNQDALSDSFTRKMKNSILYKSEASTAKKYARTIRDRVIPDGVSIDAVITSACPFIEMEIGYELKLLLGCKWISEFRDLPFTDDVSDVTHRMKKFMVHELESADAIISIAPKGKEFLVENKLVVNPDIINIITNGFSTSDIVKAAPTSDEAALVITHTGSLYSGNRRADLLFKAIAAAKKKSPGFGCVFECAGGNNETLVETAGKYGLENIVNNHGFIPRSEALSLQHSADCLLILCENHPGSLVAKLFEYMLAEKPIISITCGDIAESEETAFINSLYLGIAVGEANGESDVERLADYLIMQYQRKMSGEGLFYEPDREAIKGYDHDNIAKKINNLISEVLA